MKEQLKPIILLVVVFALFSIIFFGQSSNFLVDFSREITIPYQILQGQKIFKDIFLVYGFWGYFVNFILYKICLNSNMLLYEANLISLFIVILFYQILYKYSKNAKISLFFSFALIFCSIFSCATFSFVVPYSFSTLWAYFSLYLIVFSLLYRKDTLLYLALGLLFVSKVEFFVFAFIFILFYKIFKKESFSIKNLYILAFPAVFFIYFFLNHISLNDIQLNTHFLKLMAKTYSLSYFYKGMGVLFEIKYFIFNLKNFTLYLFVFGLTYLLYLKNKKVLFYIITLLFFSLCNIVFVYNLGIFLLSILFFYLLFKKKITPQDTIIYAFSIIMSVKSVFALNIFGYSNFSFVFVIFNIYFLLTKILEKKFLIIHFSIFLVILGFLNVKCLFFEHKSKYIKNNSTIFLKTEDYEKFTNTDKFIESTIKND